MAALRWGIIGCGDIARNTFAPCLVQSPACELVAVCRRDGERAREFAAQFGTPRWYTDAEALLADAEVDAVVIATPPSLHAAQTIAAARAGKHVLVEKPMAMSTTECRAMREACRDANVRLGVAYRRRLFPQVVRVKQLLAEAAIGRVTLVRGHYSGWYQATPGQPEHWRLDPAVGGGGVLMDMACHRLEVMLNLGGPTTEVSAYVETVEHDWPVDDTVCMLLRFASGALGVHSTTWTSPPRHDFIEVDGTRGKIRLDPMEHWADALTLVTPQGEHRISVAPVSGEFQDLAMIEDFVQAVRERREPVCDGAAGEHTQAVIDAAYASARERRPVAVAA